MTLISLICLLALSSSAFGRSTYGSFPTVEPVRDTSFQRPILTSIPTTQNAYGQIADYSLNQHELLSQGKVLPSSMSNRIIPSSNTLRFDTPTVLPLGPSDLLCRGQRPETIIPLEGGRRFVVCLEESKGVEQSCPKGLFFHTESRRCERKLGPLENPCSSQPCLNNGQCVVTDVSSYQCKCAPGYDGINCELDARICHTQQPCGSAPDTRCQSFRAGAALQYVCIHQSELAYGLSGQQVVPSPCRTLDGAHPLSISDKGFIMCDGERMFIESCPGGTIWDDMNKACVWPDMFGFVPPKSVSSEYLKPTGYSQNPVLDRPVETLKTMTSYGQNIVADRSSFETKPITNFGQNIISERPTFETLKPNLPFSSNSIVERPAWENVKPLVSTIERPNWETVKPLVSTIERPTFETVKPTFESFKPTFESFKPTFENVRPTFESIKPTTNFVQNTMNRPTMEFDNMRQFSSSSFGGQQAMPKQDFRSMHSTSY